MAGRRIQVKIWPEITSIMPAMIPIDRIANSKSNPIDIDFSYTHKVDSCGLTILLISILKFSKRVSGTDWDSKMAKKEEINEALRLLNFYFLLVSNIPNSNLFWINEREKLVLSTMISRNIDGEKVDSLPIFELNFTNDLHDKRLNVDLFKKFLIQKLFFLHEKYDFEVAILIQILVEMAKNTADHTDTNGYFGMDLYYKKNTVELNFAFGDLGIGINQSFRDHIKMQNPDSSRAKHLGLEETYKRALSVGETTKPESGVNKGIGMPTIFALCQQLEMKLSVFDAESRGLLSDLNSNTHEEIRKILYNIGFKVGFYYFGQTIIYKNEN